MITRGILTCLETGFVKVAVKVAVLNPSDSPTYSLLNDRDISGALSLSRITILTSDEEFSLP